jgi:hypothetical protein
MAMATSPDFRQKSDAFCHITREIAHDRHASLGLFSTVERDTKVALRREN